MSSDEYDCNLFRAIQQRHPLLYGDFWSHAATLRSVKLIPPAVQLAKDQLLSPAIRGNLLPPTIKDNGKPFERSSPRT